MSVKLQALVNAPVIELDTIDSTNNYAMQLIDADTAQAGLTIVSDEQTMGKGQRGRIWVDTRHQSLLSSIVFSPNRPVDQQFSFNILLSLAISDYLQEIHEHWDVRIKWPNDIIINDKKAGGILIENVIRGNTWAYSVVGVGINVLQEKMPSELPHATSLKIASNKTFVIFDLLTGIRERMFQYFIEDVNPNTMLLLYNQTLYRKGQLQRFSIGDTHFTATVIGATINGMLQLKHTNGDIVNYNHGAVTWIYE